MRQSGGPCPFECKTPWPHKSKIDSATIRAYARPSAKRPRIIKFGYKIPIVPVSQEVFERNSNDGYALLADRPPDKIGPLEAFWAGFRNKYPRAWGYAMLSKVAFNARHTEALIGVFQVCGENCRSFETIFLHRFGNRWRVIERIPEYAEKFQTAGNTQRYRGPAGERQNQSQIVAIDALGSPPRAESDDAARVYRAVLDSLYSFGGQSPRLIVITENRAYANSELKTPPSRLDSSTIASFQFNAAIYNPFYPRFKYRIPVTWIDAAALKDLERAGAPLAATAAKRMENEQSPLWLAFHARYPRAWGYASFGKPGFNPLHTQALVTTQHFCGAYCVSTDVWFLERKGERWRVVERMPRDNQANLGIDGLRYLGLDADPKDYGPRRVHGIVSNVLTGQVLRKFDVAVYQQNTYWRTIRTDSAGRYTLGALPMNGGIVYKVRCPIAARSDSLFGGVFATRLGMDTTINIALNYRHCLHLNRAHPAIANATKSNTETDAESPSEAEDSVYVGMLRALYPRHAYENGRIMLQPVATGGCANCIQSGVPRLVRQGVLDPSTEVDFAAHSHDLRRLEPLVPYSRKVKVMDPEDQELFRGPEALDAIKDAFPGVSTLIGFSRVGFNDSATQALVDVRIDSAGESRPAETILLKKTGTAWRLALRHVERETTSGEWIGNRCEATQAPDRDSNAVEFEKLIGDFQIVRVGASRRLGGEMDSLRVRLDASKPSPRHRNVKVATADLLDARGRPDEKVAGRLQRAGKAATISFSQRLPEGVMQLDGWLEQYTVLRTNGREFFGTWSTSSGPTVPFEGYFCARAVAHR
jgi:hypothetical protein